MLGTRGRGKLSASLTGSLSRYALSHAQIPVLIVRAEAEGESEPSGSQETATAVA